MARKPRASEVPQAGPRVVTDKDKAKQILQAIKDEVPSLRQLDVDAQRFQRWRHEAKAAVSNIFGAHSENDRSFSDIQYFPSILVGSLDGGDLNDYSGPYQAGLNQSEALLESMLKQIALYWDEAPEGMAPATSTSTKPLSRKIFIVHGHNGELLQKTARLLTQLRLDPIILHEQANKGQTIIEKFEANSDVSYAIILATADDEGRKLPDSEEARKLTEGLSTRARQNVVFEMGYFIGRLGRGNVCTIVETGVELQSDIQGIVYVEYDAGGSWRYAVAKEIRAAGIDIDMNQI